MADALWAKNPIEKSREFPWWLVPAGRYPVMDDSCTTNPMNSRDGYVVPAGRVSVAGGSRTKNPVNSRGG